MLCVMKKLSWVLETSFIIPYILNTCSMSYLCLDTTNKKNIFIYTRPSTVFCSGKPTLPAGVWISSNESSKEQIKVKKVIRISQTSLEYLIVFHAQNVIAIQFSVFLKRKQHGLIERVKVISLSREYLLFEEIQFNSCR